MSTVKTVAGGTAIIGTFGTAGYGINKYVNKDEGKIEIEFLYEEFASNSIGKKIEDSKFLIIHNKHNTSDWEKLIEKNYGKENKTIAALQEECKKLLTTRFTTVNDNYKNAVKKCTKIVSFKERMKQMSIEFLSDYTTTVNEAGGRDSNQAKWDKIKTNFDTEIVGKSSIEMETKGKGDMAKWKEYCGKEANVNWTKIKTTEAFEKEWEIFIKVCSPKTEVLPSYWIIK